MAGRRMPIASSSNMVTPPLLTPRNGSNSSNNSNITTEESSIMKANTRNRSLDRYFRFAILVSVVLSSSAFVQKYRSPNFAMRHRHIDSHNAMLKMLPKIVENVPNLGLLTMSINDSDKESHNSIEDNDNNNDDDQPFEIVIVDSKDNDGSNNNVDDLPEEMWQQAEQGKPSEWMVMKDILGINLFTYILAALIVFFLSMNTILGPGWLGGVIGIPGTGEFTQMSDSLPDTIDLGNSDYLI